MTGSRSGIFDVRRSKRPMVALMVCYTMTSLWIIAQPIVSVR